MIDPQSLFSPRRKITGISALLLPFDTQGGVDWAGFETHVARTVEAGLTPAVNMDTGYAHLLDEPTREEVLKRTAAIAGADGYVAGAFVADTHRSVFDRKAYQSQIELIQRHHGTPIIFQSFGLVGQPDQQIIESYAFLGSLCQKFFAFELAETFAPFGKIYSLDVIRGLLDIPECHGAKHASLRRDLEWERLALRNQHRPDFKLLTGNDLAIDMVVYGSDYLLGLSTFAPDLFALRDRYWWEGDRRFFELNDVLQYLGFFAFRAPVPAYKHSAAMFLNLRGWIQTDRTHPDSPARPASDRLVLGKIYEQLQEIVSRWK